MTATATPSRPIDHGPALDSYIRRHIRTKAYQLTQRPEFRSHEQDDLQQELSMEVVRRWPSFNPDRSSRRTFLSQVVNNKVRKLIRDRNGVVGQFQTRQVPLDSVGAECLSRTGRPDVEQAALEMDVADVMGSLPYDLQEVCRDLMLGDGRMPHSIPDDVLLQLRSHLEAAGLRAYLEA